MWTDCKLILFHGDDKIIFKEGIFQHMVCFKPPVLTEYCLYSFKTVIDSYIPQFEDYKQETEACGSDTLADQLRSLRSSPALMPSTGQNSLTAGLLPDHTQTEQKTKTEQ